VREVTFWRWIFGLALLLAVAVTWLLHAADPVAHPLDLLISVVLSLVVAYVGSLFVVGMFALAWFTISDFAWSFWRFFVRVIGVRPEP